MHRIKFSVALSAAVSLALLFQPNPLLASDRDANHDLKGSWSVVVTANAVSICNGPEIAPPPPPFTELASYADGGVVTETNTQLNFNSAPLSPGLPFNASDGHGAWKRSGNHFAANFIKLLYDTSGNYVANTDIAERIWVDDQDEDSFTGTFTIRFSFLDNSPSICSSGRLAAQRIAVP